MLKYGCFRENRNTKHTALDGTVIPVSSGLFSELTLCLTIIIRGANCPIAVTAITAVILNFEFDVPILLALY